MAEILKKSAFFADFYAICDIFRLFCKIFWCLTGSFPQFCDSFPHGFALDREYWWFFSCRLRWDLLVGIKCVDGSLRIRGKILSCMNNSGCRLGQGREVVNTSVGWNIQRMPMRCRLQWHGECLQKPQGMPIMVPFCWKQYGNKWRF